MMRGLALRRRAIPKGEVMKRLLLGVSIFGAIAFLGGCPIYPSQTDNQVCNAGGCYSCPDGTYSNGTCVPWQCSTDTDCSPGYVCGSNNTCVPASQDAGAGDCSQTGCPAGLVCKLSGGTTQCVPAPAGSDGGNGADAASGDDAATPDASSDTGTPADAGADAPDAAMAAGPCNADSACGGQGAKCIDGQCAAQSQLCSDTTQCVATGEACVDGVCEPRCSASNPCPSGYACDFTRGVCDVNPSPCTTSSSCQGGSVCVEGHCAPPCSSGDAAACPTDQVCVNGGCIPDQAAAFTCQNDGQSGQLANTCDTSSICVHHDCYVACGFDAGACPSGEICKQVTVSAGTYAVCGTSSDLGSACDPASGNYCTGGVCIDGYCK